jgi:hypothetical protein
VDAVAGDFPRGKRPPLSSVLINVGRIVELRVYKVDDLDTDVTQEAVVGEFDDEATMRDVTGLALFRWMTERAIVLGTCHGPVEPRWIAQAFDSDKRLLHTMGWTTNDSCVLLDGKPYSISPDFQSYFKRTFSFMNLE